MNAPLPSRQALVVSGGGAGAAYGVGILKALVDGESPSTGYSPLDPDIYTGTSAGALNAAFMVSQPDESPAATVRDLEQIWVDQVSANARTCGSAVYRTRGNVLRYFNPQCFVANPVRPFIEFADDVTFFAGDLFRRALDFLLSAGSLERRIFEFVDLSQFIDDRSFRRLLPELIDLDGIRRSEKVLKIIATNWRTGAVSVFGNIDLTDEIGYEVLKGAAAIPGVFQPGYAGGVPYIDGGLVMNVPLMPAIEAGANTLHVVYYDPDVKNIPLKQVQNTLDTIDRSRMIDWATRTNEDIDTARWINEGLELIQRLALGEDLSSHETAVFIRVAAKIDERIKQGNPYRKLTIHRYHPRDDPAGPAGRLNFDRDHLIDLIERGFADAAAHDCVESQCLLPDPNQRPPAAGSLCRPSAHTRY